MGPLRSATGIHFGVSVPKQFAHLKTGGWQSTLSDDNAVEDLLIDIKQATTRFRFSW